MIFESFYSTSSLFFLPRLRKCNILQSTILFHLGKEQRQSIKADYELVYLLLFLSLFLVFFSNVSQLLQPYVPHTHARTFVYVIQDDLKCVQMNTCFCIHVIAGTLFIHTGLLQKNSNFALIFLKFCSVNNKCKEIACEYLAQVMLLYFFC